MPRPSGSHLRTLVVNSVVCYVLAFLFTTVLHECGHALIGSWSGSHPVLHHNYVEHMDRDALPVAYQAWIALAGPLVSLLQGMAFLFPSQRQKGGGLFQLFALWCMLLGFGNFLGYLMTGPFFTTGDIGKVLVLLDVPMALRILLAVIGAAALTFINYRVTTPFLCFAPQQQLLESVKARMAFNFRIIILPWLIGATTMTLLYLPVVAIVSIIYPISSGMVFIFPWKNAKRVKDATASGTPSLAQAAWPLYAALLGGVLVFRFVLAPGIAF